MILTSSTLYMVIFLVKLGSASSFRSFLSCSFFYRFHKSYVRVECPICPTCDVVERHRSSFDNWIKRWWKEEQTAELKWVQIPRQFGGEIKKNRTAERKNIGWSSYYHLVFNITAVNMNSSGGGQNWVPSQICVYQTRQSRMKWPRINMYAHTN